MHVEDVMATEHGDKILLLIEPKSALYGAYEPYAAEIDRARNGQGARQNNNGAVGCGSPRGAGACLQPAWGPAHQSSQARLPLPPVFRRPLATSAARAWLEECRKNPCRCRQG